MTTQARFLTKTRHAVRYAAVVVMTLLAAGGCDFTTLKWPVGRDTYEAFGDGRFQLLKTPNKTLFLYDCGRRETVADDVVKWRCTRNGVVIAIEKNGYCVVAMHDGAASHYSKLQDIPGQERQEFIGLGAKDSGP
jgi:hypothetical protein